MKNITKDQNLNTDPFLNNKNKTLIFFAVILASMGYFVDIYDLLLFSIVRVPSLRALGLSGQILTDKGIMLLNVQMIGLLLGGICWGILGDKKGRLYVLFGSIFLYSVANIANGFVNTINQYAFWRFVAGFGLAGELGAGITLVSELMPKAKRGYATTIVASVGVSGAVVGFFVAELFDWRTSFFVGGALGITLLLLRVGVSESGMFGKSLESNVKKGDFLSLFNNRRRFLKYLRCIVIGIPLWYVVGILVTLSPEFGKVLGVVGGEVNAGAAVSWCYGGLVLGDIFSGLISQYLKSRLKVVFMFLVFTSISISAFFLFRGLSLRIFYFLCLVLGFSVGYWVIFMTIAAEQFGTNIRATVTTTVPNFVRGALVPVSILFQFLKEFFSGSIIYAASTVGILCIGLAFWALSNMGETFAKDLDYLEE